LNKTINAMYFSATDTTKKIVTEIASKISNNSSRKPTIKHIDFTLPEARKKEPAAFMKEDVVIIGVPVYAGRVPNILLKYLNSITSDGALAVAVVVYGNRHYDDALLELKDILELHNFTVIAAGAFIGEHSFSKTLGANRPDEKDMIIAENFANQIYSKLINQDAFCSLAVKGNRPYMKYFIPKNEKGEPDYDFRKIAPKTNNSDCIDCKLCVEVCPMGSIDFDDVSKINGICIKCCACIKKCPTQAKYIDDLDFIRHKTFLEVSNQSRKEPELFI